MPNFIAALVAATLFCGGLAALNGLTRLAMHLHLAPTTLSENGAVQIGLALASAVALWRRATGLRNAKQAHDGSDSPDERTRRPVHSPL